MASPTRRAELVAQWPTALIAIALFAGLYFVQWYSYGLFHCLAEMFSIVVACTIFAVFWNVRQFLDNAFYLFIGIAYLCVALLDLFHTLSVRRDPRISRLRDESRHPAVGDREVRARPVVDRGVVLHAAPDPRRLLVRCLPGRLGGSLRQHFLVGHLSRVFRRRCRADSLQDRLRVRHLRPVSDRLRVAHLASRGIRPWRVSAPGRIDRSDGRVGTRLHAVPGCHQSRQHPGTLPEDRFVLSGVPRLCSRRPERAVRPAVQKSATSQGGGGSGEQGQERFSGQHEPRDPDADERRHRHDGPGARHQTHRTRSAITCGWCASRAIRC